MRCGYGISYLINKLGPWLVRFALPAHGVLAKLIVDEDEDRVRERRHPVVSVERACAEADVHARDIAEGLKVEIQRGLTSDVGVLVFVWFVLGHAIRLPLRLSMSAIRADFWSLTPDQAQDSLREHAEDKDGVLHALVVDGERPGLADQEVSPLDNDLRE